MGFASSFPAVFLNGCVKDRGPDSPPAEQHCPEAPVKPGSRGQIHFVLRHDFAANPVLKETYKTFLTVLPLGALPWEGHRCARGVPSPGWAAPLRPWESPRSPSGAAPGWKRMLKKMPKLTSLSERLRSLKQLFRGLCKADRSSYEDEFV